MIERWHSEDRGYTTPCWIWEGYIREDGYGEVGGGRRGSRLRAHRAVYEDRVGPVPSGHELDHLCRVLSCVNPAHLEAVTHTENVRRGRATKLTAADVQEIRRLGAGRQTKGEGIFSRASGVSNRALARQFGVSHEAIGAILRGEAWVM